MRRRHPRAPRVLLEPPLHIRRFVASEWGWDGPRYETGHLVLGHYDAERRYFAAWSEWMDDNGVGLEDWWDLCGQPPMVPDEPWDGALL